MTGSNQPASGRSRTAITYARVGDLGIALLGGGCFVSFGMVVVFYQTRVVRNKEPTTNQNNYLTGKAPYRFESAFLQQRVACEPDIFMRSRGSADQKRKRTQQSPEPWSGMTNLTPARDRPGALGWHHHAVDRGWGAVDGERVFIGGIVSREKSARGGEA